MTEQTKDQAPEQLQGDELQSDTAQPERPDPGFLNRYWLIAYTYRADGVVRFDNAVHWGTPGYWLVDARTGMPEADVTLLTATELSPHEVAALEVSL